MEFNELSKHMLGKILPDDKLPRIEPASSMPGYESVGDLEQIGDAKMVERIGAGAYIKPDVDGIAEHYFKGILLKENLGKKLDLENRDDHINNALGYGLVSHYYLDEFGLTMTEPIPYPEYIYEACKKILITEFRSAIASLQKAGQYDSIDLNDYNNVVASFPRGKNSGFPWIVSGMDRLQNDLTLSTNALLAKLMIDGKQPIDIFDGMLLSYTVFSRFQRNGKAIPMMLERPSQSFFFEPRRRVVNGGVKALGMALKPLVKWHTVVGLGTSIFAQDRADLQKRAAGHRIASDKSRFDLRHGGVKLKQGLDMLWEIASEFATLPPTIKELLHYEAALPTVVAYGYPAANAYVTDATALRSGSATTSRVGSVMNLMNELIVTNAMLGGTNNVDDIVKHHLQFKPTVVLGDDAIRFYPATEEGKKFADLYREHINSTESVGVPTEEEIPAKFLGYNFKDDGTLLHSAAPLSNMFFPERFKKDATASMLSRYIILKEHNAMASLEAITKMMQSESYAASVYSAFHKDCYSSLAEHYSTHPKGGAKQMFATLPNGSWDGKLIQKHLMSDLDEILLFISKGSSYDFNYALIGHPEINDLVEESDTTVEASINQAVNRAVEAMSSTQAAKLKSAQGSRTGGQGTMNRIDKVNEVLRLFTYDNEEAIIAGYKAMLPRIARKVSTIRGDVYIGDI